MKVARDGEAAQPRTPAPNALRPLFRLTRPTPAAYRTITEVVDTDEEFRSRVAEEADEDLVGRAGWLWLTRPEGWENDPVFEGEGEVGPDDSGGGADSPGAVGGDGDPDHNGARSAGGSSRVIARLEEKLARANESLDQARDKAERGRTRARQLSEQVADLTADRDRWMEEATRAREERLEAVRQLKAVEADLAVTRRDLKEARRAVAEAEEQARIAAAADRGPSTPDRPSSAPSVGHMDRANPLADPEPQESGEVFDREGARRSVEAAASAASALARALADTAAALEDRRTTSGDTGPARPAATVAAGGGEPRPRRSVVRHRQPTVPPGLFSDSPETQRSLVADPAVTVVVDGYNLARTLWSGLEPEEERRRTVGLLDEVALRGGAPITVVFDGDDREVSPVASRVVRVLYSSEGRTADDEIAALVPRVPADQPVLVVSTDREVAAAALANGAVTLSSAEFLAAIGR